MNTITMIDRGTGLEEAGPLWPAISSLAICLDLPRDRVEKLLFDGQELRTAGFVYRMTPAQVAAARETLRELANDRLAMAY